MLQLRLVIGDRGAHAVEACLHAAFDDPDIVAAERRRHEVGRSHSGPDPHHEQRLGHDDGADAGGRRGDRDCNGNDHGADECVADEGNQPAEPVAVAIGLRLVEGDDHAIQCLLRLRELGQRLRELGDPLIDRHELGLLRVERAFDGRDRLGKVIQLELNREHPGFDPLDVGNQLLGPIAEVLIAKQRHHAIGLTADVQPLGNREQTYLGPQHVGDEGKRQRGMDLVRRRSRESRRSRIDVDWSVRVGPEDRARNAARSRYPG
jgi:hypothetical protein